MNSEVLDKIRNPKKITNGQELLNLLFQIAPQNRGQTVEELIFNGWTLITDFRPFEPSGKADREELLITLYRLQSDVALSDNFWSLCIAKHSGEEINNPVEKDRIHALLKKPAEKTP